MGPVLYNRFSTGPTIALSHSQNHPSFQFPSQSMQGLQAFDSGSWSLDTAYASSSKAQARHSTSWTSMSSAKTLYTNPSRKRSRHDTDGLDESRDDAYNPAPRVAPPAPVMEEPIYGEGMILLNPRTGLALSAESQTGTWFEENAEKKTATAPPLSSRHLLSLDAGSSLNPSRKCQRLDISAPGLDDVSLACIRQRLQSTTHDDDRRSLGNSGTSTTLDEPHVDDVTLLLGISWQRVNRDNDMAPAIHGWEKYINNHFSRYLCDARILLKNRSLNAYLVAALPAFNTVPTNTSYGHTTSSMSTSFEFDPRSCFFLFKEDLTEAQLVGSSVDTCLQNLRSTPMNFESPELLRASEKSPERAINATNGPVDCVVGNGIPIARISKGEYRAVNSDNDGISKDGVGMGMGTDMDLDY